MLAANSWIYAFSKFTPEALLLEGFIICSICAAYAFYWILYKRKLGSVSTQVPAGVVKDYLNILINDAESLRAQLFGLLASSGLASPELARAALLRTAAPEIPTASAGASVDPAALQKLGDMERKIMDQAKAMDSILAEKARIERELADARASGKGAPSADADSSGEIAKLNEKIKVLEGRLAEYSVIEDDLANLKRLQQENAQLKTSLAGKGGAPISAETPAPAARIEPSLEPQVAPAVAAVAAAETASEPAVEPVIAEPAVMEPAPAAVDEASFEGLVDQVEKSLQEAQPMETPPVEAAAEATPSTSAAPAATVEQSDADLVAEFEKMLNG